jgi:hypothetical protein
VAPAPYAGVAMTNASDTIDHLQPLLSAWRAELAGATSVSASAVQDRLLDLWGALEADDDRRVRVEAWLTETLSRHLYTVSDLEARIATL